MAPVPLSHRSLPQSCWSPPRRTAPLPHGAPSFRLILYVIIIPTHHHRYVHTEHPLSAFVHASVHVLASFMPKAKSSSSNTPDSSTALNPRTYRALKTEQGVFTTPPYSGDLKGLWKFKDAEAARESSAALWERFVMFR